MSASPLNGKVVVVTGASAGIGRASALAFGREGARLALAARRMDKLDELRSEMEAQGVECLTAATDVSDRDQVQSLVSGTVERFGRLDILVNNAGYGLAASLEHTTPEEMRRIWDVNFMGAFHGCQAALPHMRRQGAGHIINVSSLAARFPMPLGAAYSATKAAMNAMSEALDMELAGTGIRASTMLVSFTETDFFTAMIKKIPDGRKVGGPVATAESVASRIVHCALHPRADVVFLPVPSALLAISDLAPGLYRRLALWYMGQRTNGAEPRPSGE